MPVQLQSMNLLPIWTGCASGNFRIVTPQQCIEPVSDLDEIQLDPLFGGLPPDLAWQSLELFIQQVLPA
jgi:hypothetical protein